MKKFYGILGFFLLTLSCSNEEQLTSSNEMQFIEPSLSASYFNSVMASNGLHNASISNVSITDYKGLESKSTTFKTSFSQYVGDSSTSIVIEVDGEPMIFHVLPLSSDPSKAHLYFEKSGEINQEYLEITVNDLKNAYNVSWTSSLQNGTGKFSKPPGGESTDRCNPGIVSCDCEEGAEDVMKIGGTIAFFGFFGCVPCPFVGGAVAAVAAVISLGC